MVISGTAITYGDDISTDHIYPGRYTYLLLSEEEMASHAMEDLDQSFSGRDVAGGILVAGTNFGCGSAREQAVKCLKLKGINAIVAKSIARIFFRNCINEGLLPIVCPEAVAAIQDGDHVDIDLNKGVIKAGSGCFAFPGLPPFVMGIIECGGLIPSVRMEIEENRKGKGNEKDEPE